MSIWVLHQNFSAEDEAAIATRTHLDLPFHGLPDLTHISSPAEAMRLLRALYPGEPPETITRRFDAFWAQFHGLAPDDTIVVPLPHSHAVAIAQVSGRYTYRVGPHGSDEHLVPVTWMRESWPRRKLGKHQNILLGKGMSEVTDRDERIAVLTALPHSYNRFARFRWLMALFFAMGLIRLATQFTQP